MMAIILAARDPTSQPPERHTPHAPRPETLALTSASSITPPGPPSSPSTRLSYPARPESALPELPYATRSNSQT